MYLEASDHACPHLRETRPAETKPTIPAASPRAGCPFGSDRAPAEPLRSVVTTGSAGGWWAFATEARALEARA